ncbi:E3 ubiquitin-protein ligase NRDP1 [Halotydeus destructor]|nr:E3 ubiquitin-protein ligase NRDP1 [Halotydeus destructor]
MGFDTIRFVDLNPDLEEEFTCVICCGIIREPVVTQCGHTFCRNCVTRWIKTERNCPVCRKPCSKLCKPPVIIKNLLGRMKIRCEHEDKGCTEIMTLDSLRHHLKICDFRPKQSVFKTFFKSLLAPFIPRPVHEEIEYDTETVDDYSRPGGRPRRRSAHEDVLSFSLQSVAIVGFIYNVISIFRS